MKPQQILKIDRQIILIFDNSEACTLSPFGTDVYSTVSDGILKSAITQYKYEALENNFDLKKLKKLWNI